MKRLFEFRVYDIMKDEDNRKFLSKVKDENPDIYDRFMSLIGNKGLEIAKQKYKQYDPVEIAERSRRKTKEEKEKVKEEALRKKEEKFGRISYEIYEYLETSPLKSILPILRKEKNLTSWIKKYKTLFKGPNSFNLRTSGWRDNVWHIDVDEFNYLRSAYMKELDENVSVKIKQTLTINNNKIEKSRFNVSFNYEGFFDKFENDRAVKIEQLNSYKYVSFEEVKKLLEKFKYYMSDKYKEDWKIEQEAGKYNL